MKSYYTDIKFYHGIDVINKYCVDNVFKSVCPMSCRHNFFSSTTTLPKNMMQYEGSDRIYFSATQNNQVSKIKYNTEFRLHFSNISKPFKLSCNIDMSFLLTRQNFKRFKSVC